MSAVQRLLQVMLEAVTLPAPATVGDRAGHDRLLAERVRRARVVLAGVVDDPDGLDRAAFLDASQEWLREELGQLTAVGRYTVGPPVYGRFACVCCGELHISRRDFCEVCGRGVVVRLDRAQGSTEHNAPPAEQWPAAHPDWVSADGLNVYTRTGGSATWSLVGFSADPGRERVTWFLQATAWRLVAPPVDKRVVGLDYPRRHVVMDRNGTAGQAMVMADRFIDGYLAHWQSPTTGAGSAAS